MRSILGVSWIRACPIKEEMDYLSFFLYYYYFYWVLIEQIRVS